MSYRWREGLLALVLTLVSSGLSATDVQQKTSDHSNVPFQSEGLWVKTMLEFASSNDRPAYQEIIPCRLVDTREESAFEAPYGGPTFQPGDARVYSLRNVPATNPCHVEKRRLLNRQYEEFYGSMMATVLRVTWYNRSGDGDGTASGIVQVGEAEDVLEHGAIAAWFGWLGSDAPEYQQGIVKTGAPDGASFTLSLLPGLAGAPGAPADFTVDVLGYFVPDPSDVGSGPPGPRGPAGLRGEKGDVGPAGAIGPKALLDPKARKAPRAARVLRDQKASRDR